LNKINEKRVFIGIPIGATIIALLDVLKSKFSKNSEKIKWIPSENIHLTLRLYKTNLKWSLNPLEFSLLPIL
jgi:hypothetical protein